MSGKRNVSVCRGHELANALYIGAESVTTIRRERVVIVVCTAGAFIGCVDNVKSE